MAGMSWRWFTGHVAGLSPDAAWLRWRRSSRKAEVPAMTEEQTNAYMRTM